MLYILKLNEYGSICLWRWCFFGVQEQINKSIINVHSWMQWKWPYLIQVAALHMPRHHYVYPTDVTWKHWDPGFLWSCLLGSLAQLLWTTDHCMVHHQRQKQQITISSKYRNILYSFHLSYILCLCLQPGNNTHQSNYDVVPCKLAISKKICEYKY